MAFMTTLGLERTRRRKGISLGNIAGSTKIGTYFLEAIEREDFGKLPGGVFDRNYLRQYAAAVGIDDRELLAAYEHYQAERTREEQAGVPAARRRPFGLRWLATLVTVVAAVLNPHS